MLKLSLPLRLTLTVLLNAVLAWGLDAYLPAYVSITGELAAFIIIGSLLTLMNMFLRPLLAIITFPFHLLFTLATTIAVNAFFVFVINAIILQMDPNVVTLAITGGLTGWLIVSTILGVANWVMKQIL